MSDSNRPPVWFLRAVITVIVAVLVTGALLWVATRLRTLIFILFIALFVAVALEPAVQFLSSRGWRRQRATMIVFLSTLLAVGAFVAALVPLFADQASTLATNMPSYIESLEKFLADSGADTEIINERIRSQFEDLGALVSSWGGALAPRVVAVGNTVFGVIFRLVTIALFAFYMVSEGPRMRRTLLSALPPNRQREALRIWEIAVEKTGGYIYSRLLLAVVSGTYTVVVLSFLGVPYAFALGLWVGVLSQFVPVVGTYIAAILPLIVAMVPESGSGEWTFGRGLWVLAALVGYQQVENYFVAPKITARAMAIHPAVSVAAVIAGASLLGGIGAVLALPVAAIIQAVIATAVDRHDLVDSQAFAEEPPHRKRSRPVLQDDPD